MSVFCMGIGPLSFTAKEVQKKQLPRAAAAASSSSSEGVVDIEMADFSLPSKEKQHDTASTTTQHGLSVRNLIGRLDFWLLFVALTLGTGAGLMIINNLAQISRATGPEGHEKVGVVVSLFSIGSACGRLGFGIFTDLYEKQISRLSVLTIMLVLMAAANVGLSFGSFDVLCVFVPCLGLTFGAQASASPLIVFEMWGEKYFGQNYGVLLIGPLLGSTLLSTVSASTFYERFADHDPQDDEHGSVCEGVKCFRASLLINAGACVLAATCCLYVARISAVRGTEWSRVS
jgi:MFS family permease